MFSWRRYWHRLGYMRRISMSSQALPRTVSLISFVLMLTMLTGMIKINTSSIDDSIGAASGSVMPSVQDNGKIGKIVDIRMARENDFKKTSLSHHNNIQDIIKKFKTKEEDDNDINNIDVVYTWVNGSDPEHIKLVRRYKAIDGQNQRNGMQRMHQLAVFTTLSKTNYSCYHKLCLESNNLLVVVPQLPSHVTSLLNGSINLAGSQVEQRLEFLLSEQERNEQMRTISGITLVSLNDFHLIPADGSYKVYKAFYTADCSMALSCIPNLDRTYILRKVAGRVRYGNRALGGKIPAASFVLPDFIEKNLEWMIKTGDSFVVRMTNDTDLWKRAIEFEDVFEIGNGETFHLYKANLVWDLGDPYGYQMSAGRFADNDELKFSIRSLEKNAPWVRKIHIVTNGQVPTWLNLSHPKINMVTHDQIFANTAYLPTFSSPAIEANLHRIPGLSKRFIYINDDILMMTSVRKEDFWTPNKGFRFQLAWTAPGRNAAPCGLFNTYDCSVRHVSDIYDKAYGTMSRRVPAHVPHYFDRDIIATMVEKYSTDFNTTSSSRFRRADNMQFAFSFYYFVIHEGKWRYERLGEGEMKFFMIQDKSSQMQPKLDLFKRRPRKFACFNDDIDYGKVNQAMKLRKVVNKFFVSYFPKKSTFEL